MNKGDLVSAIARETDVYAADVEEIYETGIDVIHRALAKGEKVVISGLMSIYPTFIPERMTRNPKTGEWKMAKPCVKIKIKVSKTMIEALSNGEYLGDEEK